MATSIPTARSKLNIRLGQVPNTSDASLNYELQHVYNALHILNQYLEVLVDSLQGSDTQTPAENIRFLKYIIKPAKQKITAGHVVTVDIGDGLVVKGTSTGAPRIGLFSNSLYYTGSIQTFFGIAQNDAEIGENVRIGLGPGILKVTGAKSGQIIWGAASRGYEYQITSDNNLVFYGTVLSGDGNVYLANPQINRLAGYPHDLSGTVRILGHYLFSPIGMCVANDYVLFSDFLPWNGRTVTNVGQLYP